MAFDLFVFDSVEVPTEKRAKRWAISIEDLVTDQTGNDSFDLYLRRSFFPSLRICCCMSVPS